MAQAEAKPSPSPQPVSASSVALPNTIIRVKGLARAGAVVELGIPLAAGAATKAFAGYLTSSILQILFAGLFATDKNNPFFKYIQDRLVDFANLSLSQGQEVITFTKDQLKEAVCEAIFQEEDFKHINPELAKVIQEKKIKPKPEVEKAVEDALDDIDMSQRWIENDDSVGAREDNQKVR